MNLSSKPLNILSMFGLINFFEEDDKSIKKIMRLKNPKLVLPDEFFLRLDIPFINIGKPIVRQKY